MFFALVASFVAATSLGGCTASSEENPITPEKMEEIRRAREKADPTTGAPVDRGRGNASESNQGPGR
jgi:hypothetical protein